MIGTQLQNRYEIRREIGRGGMGIVYEAWDPLLDRLVAVKVVSPFYFTTDSKERALREAKVVAKMDHPSIVPVYDLGSHDGAMYFVMPLVEGKSYREVLQERSIRQDEIIDISIQVADALDYSHSRGIIHRDIKPENVMVAREQAVRARVMDFGLARQTAGSRLTDAGMLVGTMAYLSPERLSEGEVDGRTDIYALGVMLYEALSGTLPFSGPLPEMLVSISRVDPPRLTSFGIHAQLDRIVTKCLQKRPEDRPSRASEVAEALAACRGESSIVVPRGDVDEGAATENLRVASLLVGREGEVQELERRARLAAAGRSQFVLISGAEGTGKTALIDELVRSIHRNSSIPVLRGKFVEQNVGIPYQGFCEILQQHLQQRRKRLSDLGSLGYDLSMLFPSLSESGESRRSSEGRFYESGAREPENRIAVLELLTRALVRIADRPVIIVLEHLHAADVSVEALQYIARRLAETPAMIIGTYRSDHLRANHPIERMIESFAEDSDFLLLRLAPLTGENYRNLVATFAGSLPSEELSQDLFRATEGNPFFTRELIRALVDSGTLQVDGSRLLRLRASLDAGEMPRTVREAVDKRLHHLAPDVKQVLTTAAFVGRTVDFTDLAAISETSAEEAVDLLVDKGYLAEEEGSRGERFVFISEIVREALVEGVGPRKRRSLNVRLADHLERRFASRPERVCQRLYSHYAAANVSEKAIPYGLMAARKALAAFSPEDALEYASSVLKIVTESIDDLSVYEGDARSVKFLALQMAGNTNAALDEAWQALDALIRSGNDVALMELVHGATDTAWNEGRIEEALRWAQKGIDLSKSSSNQEALRHFLGVAAAAATSRDSQAIAYDNQLNRIDGRDSSEVLLSPDVLEKKGDALLLRGDFADAEQQLMLARQELGKATDTACAPAEIRILRKLAVAARKMGRFDDALERCREGIRLANRLDGLAAGSLESLAALVCCDAGRFIEAAEWVERGLSRIRDVQNEKRPDRLPVEASLQRARGNLLLGLGKPLEAAVEYEKGLTLCEAIGERWETSIAFFNVGDAHAQAGDLARGELFLKRALTEKTAIGDRWGLAYTYHSLASLHLDWGDPARATEEARTGLDLAGQISDPKIAAMLHITLGRASLLIGEIDAAQLHFDTAHQESESIEAAPEMIQALLGRAEIERERGRFESSLEHAASARRMAEQSGARDALADIAILAGETEMAEGDLGAAERSFELALSIAKSLGSAKREFRAKTKLAESHLARGAYDEAQRLFHSIRGRSEQVGGRLDAARAELGLAEVFLRKGDREQAWNAAEKARKEFAAISSPKNVAEVYVILCRLATQVADYRAAETYGRVAIEMFETLGDAAARELGRAYLALAAVYYESVRPDELKQALREAIGILERYKDRVGLADAYRAFGATLTRHDPEEALFAIRKAEQLIGSTGNRLGEAGVYGDLGEVLRRMGRLEGALEAFKKEQRLVLDIGWKRGIAINAFHLASIYFHRGDLQQAMEAVRVNVDVSRSVGNIGLLYGLGLRGQIHTELGLFQEARLDLDEALERAVAWNHAERLANIHRTRSDFHCMIGDLVAAEADLQAGRASAAALSEENLKEFGFLVRERIELAAARLYVSQGLFAQALDLVTPVLKTFVDLNTPIQALEAQVVALQVKFATGRLAEGELEGGVAMARALGLKIELCDLLTLQARAWHSHEALDEARQLAHHVGSPLRIARLLILRGARSEAEELLTSVARSLPDPQRALSLEHWSRA